MMAHNNDFPIRGHLHLRHNVVNNKWMRHNLEQKFHDEILDSVFTKQSQTFYWFLKCHK